MHKVAFDGIQDSVSLVTRQNPEMMLDIWRVLDPIRQETSGPFELRSSSEQSLNSHAVIYECLWLDFQHFPAGPRFFS
jgi:hypothetical protein